MTLHVAGQSISIEGGLPRFVKIGMPHLALAGLSESWLLKECGNRHWFLLAAAAGEPFPDFRDADGDQVYAVFRAVRVIDARFDVVHENDDLHFSSTLARISRTQFESRHVLTCRGRKVGELSMISSFVKRQIANVNRSVARVTLDAFPLAEMVEPSVFLQEAAALWTDGWTEHFGFQRIPTDAYGEIVIRPSPSSDFNGARFLYFSSFASLVDRMEWDILDVPISLVTGRRELFYYGNIEPGESITVQVKGVRRNAERLSHWCRLLRTSDGTRLADVFTDRMIAE